MSRQASHLAGSLLATALLLATLSAFLSPPVAVHHGVTEAMAATSRTASPDYQDGASDAAPLILHAPLNDEAITPAVARFLSRAIETADERNAICLIIEMDTPGGLLQSTREIVKEILDSRVPIVMYVSPAGARAASAGVFITLATHIAAMAPGTHIGAAHPVQVGGLPGSPSGSEQDTTAARRASAMEEKVLNDAVAWVRSLADMRGRNADVAEEMVTHSITLVAADAVDQQIVDLLADDLQQLVKVIDGRPVKLATHTDSLETAGARIESLEMWWGEVLLGVLANPNIAVILIIIGFYGVLFEMYSPGWGVSGTVGIACLLMGFYGLAVLPINIVGLALILLALALFIAEVFVTSFGALTIGGIACFIIGGLMLVDAPFGLVRVSLKVLIPFAVATGLITFFLLSRIVKAHRARVTTGAEGLTGSRAVAAEDFRHDAGEFIGYVQTHGELWRARASSGVKKGERLEVTGVDGLTLNVGRTEGAGSNTAV